LLSLIFSISVVHVQAAMLDTTCVE